MRSIHKILIVLALCAGVTMACQDDEPVLSGGLQLEKTEIAMGAEGGMEKVTVTSHDNWVASSSQPWVSVSPANGLGTAECVLEIDSTLENGARQAEIRFTVEGQESKLLTITQMGFYKQIILKEPKVEIESSADYKARNIEAVITSNIAFRIGTIEYSFAEDYESLSPEDKAAYDEATRDGEDKNWITLPKEDDLKIDLDRGARPRTIKVKFPWEMNIVPFTRVAKIRLEAATPERDQLQDDNGNAVDAFYLTVTQKPAMKITDDRAGDSLAVVTINQKIQCMVVIETSENMRNWAFVKLWEATDKAIKDGTVPRAAIGRVREVSFPMINLNDGESLPKEIKHLKYLESFTIQSNENATIRNVSLCEELCELDHLKHITVYSYGLSKLPEGFKNLGDKLETLDLSGNNFNSLPELTEVINKENFPKLYGLRITGNRRTGALNDLQKRTDYITSNRQNLGLEVKLGTAGSTGADRMAMIDLLTWNELLQLELSYNFIEGEFITDNEMKEALSRKGLLTQYQPEDFYDPNGGAIGDRYLDKLPSDTCAWLKNDTEDYNRIVKFNVGNGVPRDVKSSDVLRVLPHTRLFAINLNFLTGELPTWLVFHPFFIEWNPGSMVLQQQERGKDSEGTSVGFDGVMEDASRFDFGYYYGNGKEENEEGYQLSAYPLYYKAYVAE